MPAPTVETEVLPPEPGGARPYPVAQNMFARIAVSPQAAWFAWGFIAGAVLVGVFVWKTNAKRKAD